MSKEDEIVLFSAGRTGSTFIYQILKKIFGDRVIKTHEGEMRANYFNSDLDCVITERDVVDAFLSRLRVVRSKGHGDDFLKKLSDDKYLFSEIGNYKRELDYVDFVKSNYKGRLLCLYYEDFFNNYDFIFNKLESFFDISISDASKLDIIHSTSRKANIERQKRMDSFLEHDPETHIHGCHIFSNKICYSKDLIGEEKYSMIYKTLRRQ